LDLSIIIVSFNSLEFIKNCIRSIYKYLDTGKGNGGLSWEIVISDNGSKDGSVEFIRGMISEMDNSAIRFIELEENQGFSKAANAGAEASNGEFLLFLNPDTELCEKGLEKLINFYSENSSIEKIGAAGASIINRDGSLQYSCRAFPTLALQFYDAFFLSKLFKKSKRFGAYFMTWWDHDSTAAVDWISGAFMLIKKNIFIEAGRFSEAYFMYSEDTDLCLALSKTGYRNYYYAGYSIKHLDAAVASRNMALREAQVWKSRKIYFAKNHGWFHGQVLSILYFKYTLNRFFLYCILWLFNFKGKKNFYKNQAGICSNTLKLYFSGV